MNAKSLYINASRLLHPKVLKIIAREPSPLSPAIKIRDSFQPLHGLLTRIEELNYNSYKD